jgi:hypothetical protein
MTPQWILSEPLSEHEFGCLANLREIPYNGEEVWKAGMNPKQDRKKTRWPVTLIWAAFILFGAGCGARPAPKTEVHSPTPLAMSPTSTVTPSSTPRVLPSLTYRPSLTPTVSQTPSQFPTVTRTLTPVPTYIVLRGEVLMRSNCRYGPGAPYLYKYGLVAGSNLEVIGRNDLGTWILVRAIGGNNPCWVKASLMELKGEVMNVEPTYIPLPQSPYYRPPKGVSAIRNGNEVTVFWSPVQLREGDDSGQFPYLIEAWVCKGGDLVFTPVGTYDTAVKIPDETGCSEPSHARLYTVEKHGYSRWIEIPWPAQS